MCQSRFFDAVLDKGGAGLDPLYVREEHGVARLRPLPRALELMDAKPVLLETSLRAVLDGGQLLALGAGVKWNKLLVKFLVVLTSVEVGIVNAILLILGQILQRTLVIATLADMNQLVARRRGSGLRVVGTSSDTADIHDRIIITKTGGLRIEAYTVIATDSFDAMIGHPRFILAYLWLHKY